MPRRPAPTGSLSTSLGALLRDDNVQGQPRLDTLNPRLPTGFPPPTSSSRWNEHVAQEVAGRATLGPASEEGGLGGARDPEATWQQATIAAKGIVLPCPAPE